jgi:hypothetical protein
VEHARAGDLVEAAGTGEGVDRPPLRGEAAEDGRRGVSGRDARGRQGADDVTAAADADAERAARAPQCVRCSQN